MGRLLLALALLLGVAWFWARPKPPPPGVLAPYPPVQEALEPEDPRTLVKGSYRLEPVARFGLEARLLSKRRYRYDRGAAIAPWDFALGWGRMSDTAVLRRMRLWQADRFYFYAGSGEPPIPLQEIVESSANMHLIPATEAVERALARARPGQVVRLEGYLVNVYGPEGFFWRTSTTRKDTGAGACELVWAARFAVR
ncbi:hypothetical protein QT17_12520 [Thermus sp. 2.9]|uniref:hypothetical protein n=1 Tax=Thermus sp. (strain 2.9) TaxID=1577051 RepID=UPI000542AACA|nr:hypothetical protein [Thermus sp. 2.9]KHG64413.1 hypothetical protein QT17_12520 [Thermus sp. 2.9]